jgi:hypothetical protein
MAQRNERAWSEITVRHVAKPMGRRQESGPHLVDLREFVEACDGLPDDLPVRVHQSNLSESGRYTVEISVTQRTPSEADADA